MRALKRFILLLVAVQAATVVVLIIRRENVSSLQLPCMEDCSPYESQSNTSTEEIKTRPSASPAMPENVSCLGNCLPCQSSRLCTEVISMTTKVTKRLTDDNEYKRKVIMSSDAVNLFYAWFAPITTLIWYEVMKWQPVVILVYPNNPDFTLGPVFEFIAQQIEVAGGEVIKIVNTLPEPHYLMSMVTTCSRFAVCVKDWPEDTYVLISDIDMWPLSKEIFDRETSVPAAAHIFDPPPPYQSTYAACYLGMNVSVWREIMGFKKGDAIMEVVAGMRDEINPGSMAKGVQWGIDQKVFTRRMRKWDGFPNQVHFYGRDRSKDRLDRNFSKKFLWRPGFLDSHLLRPGFAKKHWNELRALASHLLNDEQLQWVDDYAEQFCSLVFCTNTTISKSEVPIYHPNGH